MNVLARIRAACAEVAERARSVRIDEARLLELAGLLGREPPGAPSLDPAHRHLGDPESTLAYVVSLDAINFGSGWFPVLRKRSGLSGYFTVATALAEHFEAHGACRRPACAAWAGATAPGSSVRTWSPRSAS